MKIKTFDNKEQWAEARLGKITGTKLKDLIVKRGTGKKIGFYQLIADRLATPADDENAMERGIRLEDEAIQKFVMETGKEVDTSLVLWTRDDNEDIAISPDGFIGETEAIEVKCLASARHIEALITKEIPADYEEQVLQYFIVNEKLEKLYFCFYDPRLLTKEFFFYEVTRESVQDKVTENLELERATLEEIKKLVTELQEF